MPRDSDAFDERFAAYVRERGERPCGWRRCSPGTGTRPRTVRHITITFGDFGLPVSVSPPPASVTWIPPA
jgi:hypothetical protein